MWFASKFAGVFLLLSILITCQTQPIERIAYDTIVGAKAFVDSERAAHPACNVILAQPNEAKICDPIRRAYDAKNALIDALIIYCSGPSFQNGGACQPPSRSEPAYTQVHDKLQAALDLYSQAAADVKGAAQ